MVIKDEINERKPGIENALKEQPQGTE